MSAQDIALEIKGTVNGETADYDYGNDKQPRNPLNLFNMVKRVLFELTLWTSKIPDDALRQEPADKLETTHGHARDAASWAKLGTEQIAVLALEISVLRSEQARILKMLEGK